MNCGRLLFAKAFSIIKANEGAVSLLAAAPLSTTAPLSLNSLCSNDLKGAFKLNQAALSMHPSGDNTID